MKFVCIDCDERMLFETRDVPGDGTFAAAFTCPRCQRRIALLANPMETQLVQSLGVEIGGRTIDNEPLELVRQRMLGDDDAFQESAASATESEQPVWSPDAHARLARVPAFVRGMVKKIYADYAAQRGIQEITPGVMDRARQDLGLEGM